MTLAFNEPVLEWSEHDLCVTAWVKLNCSGRVARFTAAGDGGAGITDETDPGYAAQPPIVIYGRGASGLTVTRTVNAAIEDSIAGGQANVNAAYRRVPPTTSGFTGSIAAGPIVNPHIYALAEAGSPITDAGHANILNGYEEPVTTAAACPTCGTTATCRHEVALITLHNAWRGDEAVTDYPYVAFILKSLSFEPAADSFTAGRGFQGSKTFNFSLQTNALFEDPFGIDPRGAAAVNDSKWKVQPVHSDVVTANTGGLQNLINACAI